MTTESNVKRFRYSSVLLRYRRVLFWADFVGILFTVYLAAIIRFEVNDDNLFSSSNVYVVTIFTPLYWVLALRAESAWSLTNLESRRNSLASLTRAAWWSVVFTGFTSYLLHDSVSRLWLLFTSASSFLFLAINRLIFHFRFSRAYKKEITETYILVANENDPITEADIPSRHKDDGTSVKFIRITPASADGAELWLQNLKDLVRKESVDGILIAKNAFINGFVLSEISKMYYLGITAILFYTTISSEVRLFHPIPHENWVRVQEPEIVNSGLVIKRIFDLFFSIIAIIILSPLYLIIAILIKLTSPGPILYTDLRIGQNGKLFKFPKFRTMVRGADQLRKDWIGNPDPKITERYINDPRITKIGHFLRRWSLDELPQFFCVLSGDMSIVGPRPILREELELVSGNYEFRFIAKPGLTGLWQVSGRKEVPWSDRMAMDSAYVQNWSFSKDLLLILETFFAVFTGRGSY